MDLASVDDEVGLGDNLLALRAVLIRVVKYVSEFDLGINTVKVEKLIMYNSHADQALTLSSETTGSTLGPPS